MSINNEPLPAACKEAMSCQARLLSGEYLAPHEHSQLSAHLASCTACRQTQADLILTHKSLRSAVGNARATPGFAARVMAALPSAKASSTAAPRVLAAAPRRRWSWTRASAIAAGLAASVLLVLAVGRLEIFTTPGKKAAVAIKKGDILGANGRPVNALEVGQVYTVQNTAVLSVANGGMLKLQPGAEFQLCARVAGDDPKLQLASGDVYVWGQDDAKPVRVGGSSFDAVMHKGDFFVADEGTDEPASVVIVFAGHAEVEFEEESTPLRAGQVLISMGRDDWAVSQTIELADAVELLQAPVPTTADLAALRREYEARVRGYQRELKILERQLRDEQNEQRLAELKERQHRVVEYRDAHQRRLNSLWEALPFDAIRRGLEGHIEDPVRWL